MSGGRAARGERGGRGDSRGTRRRKSGLRGCVHTLGGMMTAQSIVRGVVLGLVALGLAGCASSRAREDDKAPLVYVSMETSKGEIVVELDRAHAPISVKNFLMYADRGAYDGTIFHRVMENFVIQGGGWTADLKERAKIDAAAGKKDVPIKNEWQNGLKNVR